VLLQHDIAGLRHQISLQLLRTPVEKQLVLVFGLVPKEDLLQPRQDTIT